MTWLIVLTIWTFSLTALTLFTFAGYLVTGDDVNKLRIRLIELKETIEEDRGPW